VPENASTWRTNEDADVADDEGGGEDHRAAEEHGEEHGEDVEEEDVDRVDEEGGDVEEVDDEVEERAERVPVAGV
jgi:hypothetical protein